LALFSSRSLPPPSSTPFPYTTLFRSAMRLAVDAFQPYLCTTCRATDQDAFGFTVSSVSGATLLTVPVISHFQYAHPLRLAGVLEQARLDLTNRGCALEPWSMPYIPDPECLPETPPNY